MIDHEFYLSEEAERLGAGRDLRRAHARGELARIAPGAYVPVERWSMLGSDDRYRLLTRAIAARYPDEQFSHDSAAALWRLPSLGPWPSRVHLADDLGSGRRSGRTLVRHTVGRDPESEMVDGVRVTSLTRTVLDLARTAPFARAVGMADQALRGMTDPAFSRAPVAIGELMAALDAIDGHRGSVKARRALEFADARSATIGESLCRVQFHALGLPAPILQKLFVDDQGRMFPDFYFEEFDLAAEFDGHGKYLRERIHQRHLTEAEIVIEEKKRENRLRRQVRDVARIEWAEARDRRRLAALLRQHGVPI